MKIKVIVDDVGSNHAKVEFEENCGIEELRTMMDRINHRLCVIADKVTDLTKRADRRDT